MGNGLISLREVRESDLDSFFLHQADPVAAGQARLASKERDPFILHWKSKVLAPPTVISRTILFDAEVAGNLVCWPQGDVRLVGYWVDRKLWGRQVATRALGLFLAEVRDRPLHAYVAAANAPSIRVLEKCGFRKTAPDAVPGPDGVEEFYLRLD